MVVGIKMSDPDTSTDTIVAIGCSPDADYAFLAPLTALLWRDVVGHVPRLFLVGPGADGGRASWASGKAKIALDALRHHEIDHRFVGPVEGVAYPQVAQNVRHHAAADPTIPDDQWIMLADADLWPLRAQFYRQHVDTNFKAVLLYANGDHFEGKAKTLAVHDSGGSFQSIPTCHVTMRAKDWRELYDIPYGEMEKSVLNAMTRGLRPIRDLHQDQKGWIDWMSDQWYVTERLCRQEWFPEVSMNDKNVDGVFDEGQVRFVTRRGHAPINRLCRSVVASWSKNYDPSLWVDAHVHKKAHLDDVWEVVRPVVAAHLPQHLDWADEYQRAWS